MSVEDRDTVWSLCQALINESQLMPMGFWSKALPVSVYNNYSTLESCSFWEQLLTCYRALVETEHLTMSLKVGRAQQHSIIKWKWCIQGRAWAGSEGTNKLHEVAKMPMVPSPATLPSLSQPVPVASWQVPYDQLTEEEKTGTWFTDGSAPYAGTTWKWTAAALQCRFGDMPEGQ